MVETCNAAKLLTSFWKLKKRKQKGLSGKYLGD
jgi:hypothetical protein